MGGGGGGGAYSRGALVCYCGREGGRLFGGGRLLERGRLFEEIRYEVFFNLYFLYIEHALYKEPAVRVPSASRLKEIAQSLGLDVEEAELQEYQSIFFLIYVLCLLLSHET